MLLYKIAFFLLLSKNLIDFNFKTEINKISRGSSSNSYALDAYFTKNIFRKKVGIHDRYGKIEIKR